LTLKLCFLVSNFALKFTLYRYNESCQIFGGRAITQTGMGRIVVGLYKLNEVVP
jgi:hypothetical protein